MLLNCLKNNRISSNCFKNNNIRLICNSIKLSNDTSSSSSSSSIIADNNNNDINSNNENTKPRTPYIPKVAKQIIIKTNNMKRVEPSSNWIIISGFSKYSTYQDVVLSLNDIKYDSIDAILDKYSNLQGKWLVKLQNKMILSDLTAQMFRNPYPKLSCQLQNESNIRHFTLASKDGISNKTIRMSRVHSRCTEDVIRLFFADYDIPNGSIKKLPNDKPTYHPDKTVEYVINFSSSYEAERAVRDKNFGYLYSLPVTLEYYNLQ